MIHMTKHKYNAEGRQMSLSESFKNHCKELYTSSSVPSKKMTSQTFLVDWAPIVVIRGCQDSTFSNNTG